MVAVLYPGERLLAFLVAVVGPADLVPVTDNESIATAEPCHQALLKFSAINLATQAFIPMTKKCDTTQESVAVGVQGDAEAALSDALRLMGKGRGINLVGRKLCLTAAQHLIQWNVVSHIAGMANCPADALSRPSMVRKHADARARLLAKGVWEIVVPFRHPLISYP